MSTALVLRLQTKDIEYMLVSWLDRIKRWHLEKEELVPYPVHLMPGDKIQINGDYYESTTNVTFYTSKEAADWALTVGRCGTDAGP